MRRMKRRDFLTTSAAAVVAAASSAPSFAQAPAPAPIKRKARLKQSLFRTVFGQNTPGLTTFDEQCREAAHLGVYGFDLVGQQDWPTMKKYGLVPTLGGMNFASLTDGLVHKEQWPEIEKKLRDEAEQCAAAGCKGMITFAGQKKNLTFEQGMDLTVEFMNRVKAMLEDKGVALCMENANSRYPDNVLGRPDQLCDRPSWGLEMCRRVNSPAVKMCFDIYHAQIMEGNIAATIKDNIQWIHHFHCAGVPGRHEIDASQELNYRFIAQTIVDAGYTGYIAHEYRPTPGRNPLEALEAGIQILDV
jgi:hydroxypyruvate isomerase